MKPQRDYSTLPATVALEDTIAEVDARAVPDPDFGIRPEDLYLIRHAG